MRQEMMIVTMLILITDHSDRQYLKLIQYNGDSDQYTSSLHTVCFKYKIFLRLLVSACSSGYCDVSQSVSHNGEVLKDRTQRD